MDRYTVDMCLSERCFKAIAGLVAFPVVGIATIVEVQLQQGSVEDWAARLEKQLIAIAKHDSDTSSGPRFTRLPEDQINAFLKLQGADHLPKGISDARVQIGRDDSLTVEAVLDLDSIRDSRPRHWLDPIRYLGGRLTVIAIGRARSSAGVANLEIESVTVGGIPMPIPVLEEIVRHFTRGHQYLQERGSNGPIDLPYRIREIRLSPGLAVVVQ